MAEAWAHGPYPVFRRLAFFAAAQKGIIPARSALDWLLADDQWWLWSDKTKRETLCLLVALAPQLDATMLAKLEHAILAGPPRPRYQPNSMRKTWTKMADRDVWLWLAKLNRAGAMLSKAGKTRLKALAAQHQWQLAEDDRDEFPSPHKIPHTKHGVLDYLREHPERETSQTDYWAERCQNDFDATAYALCELAQQRDPRWPVTRWRAALQAWRRDKTCNRSWRLMAPLVAHAPDEWLQSLSREVSWWLQSVAQKASRRHEENFLKLAQRLLRLDFENDGDDSVESVTQALLDWGLRPKPDDGQGLPETLKPILTALCDTQIDKFWRGRAVLAEHVIPLFRADTAWTQQHLLPLFDWDGSASEAQNAWEGFLPYWRDRPTFDLFGFGASCLPLLKVDSFKSYFLATADHCHEASFLSRGYPALLTSIALDDSKVFTPQQLADAVRKLPQEGLCRVAETLARALEKASDPREDYWNHRIEPFWDKVWPQSKDRMSHALSAPLAQLCIAAGDAFPQAMKKIGDWLQPIPLRPAGRPDDIDDTDDTLSKLQSSGLLPKFPREAMRLLGAILPDKLKGTLKFELIVWLDSLAQAQPALQQERAYQNLDTLARRAGV